MVHGLKAEENMPQIPLIKPIEIARDCYLRGETDAAQAIFDLIKLARAFHKINMAYRVQASPPGKAIDTSNELNWMID